MAERICDRCGEKRDMKGGRTCEEGHFLCKYCVVHSWGFVGEFSDKRKKCPLDDSDLT